MMLPALTMNVVIEQNPRAGDKLLNDPDFTRFDHSYNQPQSCHRIVNDLCSENHR